ncbi:MAG: hypothetical protein GF383_01660 [Candidatus Lokiarchaeota archaeon]|nr:hypothetical protein [Candidatus Lokiarchaeota archaeon]
MSKIDIKYDEIDENLRKLAVACLKTKNYRKLVDIGYKLLRNYINELGLKLGVRPRDKTKEEFLFQYAELLNSIFYDNFEIYLFSEELVQKLQDIEVFFLPQWRKPTQDMVKELFSIYYDVRKILIPDLYEVIDHESYEEHVHPSLYAFRFYGKNREESVGSTDDAIKSYVSHKLTTQKKAIEKKLKKNYDSSLLKEALYLRKTKEALEKSDNGKIRIRGALKDDLHYKVQNDVTMGFMLLGVCVLFALFGIAALIQVIFTPSLTYALSTFLFASFGFAGFTFYIYYNNYRKEDE